MTGLHALLQGLYGMADASADPGRTHVEIGTALLSAGVGVVQVRWKDGSDQDVAGVVEALLPLARARGALLIVNDRLDVATGFPEVGLHLGQDDVDPVLARAVLGGGRVIGRSTHTLEQVMEARSLPVDYLAFGPIWDGAGKHRSPGDRRAARAPVGVEALRAAVALAGPLPVVAIGGVKKDRLPELRDAGVAAWAVLGAIGAAPDLPVAIAGLR